MAMGGIGALRRLCALRQGLQAVALLTAPVATSWRSWQCQRRNIAFLSLGGRDWGGRHMAAAVAGRSIRRLLALLAAESAITDYAALQPAALQHIVTPDAAAGCIIHALYSLSSWQVTKQPVSSARARDEAIMLGMARNIIYSQVPVVC